MKPEVMLEEAARAVRVRGTSRGVNLVAYSGGVDSALVACIVHRVFPGNTHAVIGVSGSLPREQLDLARMLAGRHEIPLVEIETHEGSLESYVENEGSSCYACKRTLYAAIWEVGTRLLDKEGRSGEAIVVFNGTNAEDLEDPTRVGLRAAEEFGVESPLRRWRKAEVRVMSRHLGLPNWGFAASPCLRSRLQPGVRATPANLARIEAAEAGIRNLLALEPQDNLRVRHLAGDVARIELDPSRMPRLAVVRGEAERLLSELGFTEVSVRPFRSGSLSFRV